MKGTHSRWRIAAPLALMLALPMAASADAGVDPFGITMLYPTASGGEVWYMNMAAPQSDPRFMPQGKLSKNLDGSWSFTDDEENRQARLMVKTSAGYDQSKVNTDHAVLAERGYMQSPRDWKNVEMTGYVRVEEVLDDDDEITWYARGGKHSDPKPFCEGSSYKGDLRFDGSVRFAKEQWHVNYNFWPKSPQPYTTPIVGRWVGFKLVMANTDPTWYLADANSGRHVRLELWVDAGNNNVWTRALSRIDEGGWGESGWVCGAVPFDQPITWGGPLATFRWDNVKKISFKNLSVREINPSSVF
jgi:hypothetical protein